MGEFFRGRRRKVGLLTLVLALMFMGGWVRSQLIVDGSVRNLGGFRYVIHSFDGMIDFIRMSEMEGWPSVIWDSSKLSQMKGYDLDDDGVRRPFDPWESLEMVWKWDWGRFHFGSGTRKWGPKKLKCQIYIIPYWSIVFPLTVLSTYLLLSKPENRPLRKLLSP